MFSYRFQSSLSDFALWLLPSQLWMSPLLGSMYLYFLYWSTWLFWSLPHSCDHLQCVERVLEVFGKQFVLKLNLCFRYVLLLLLIIYLGMATSVFLKLQGSSFACSSCNLDYCTEPETNEMKICYFWSLSKANAHPRAALAERWLVSNSPLQSLKNFCEKQKSEKLMSVSVACYFMYS